MVAYDNKSLYIKLDELDVVDKEALKKALDEAEAGGKPLHRVILEKELIKDDNLGKVMSDSFGLRYVNLSKIHIPPETLQIVPEIVAKKQQAIVFEKDKDIVKMAMFDPNDTEFVEFVRKKTGDKVEVYFATEHDIEEAVNLYEKDIKQTFDEIMQAQIDEAGTAETVEAPIAKIVGTLIEYAYRNKASDIHIEPEDEDSLVRFRIDGVLHDVLHLPKKIHHQVIARIKVLSKLRTDEHMGAQDGKMQAILENENLDIRVSIVPIVEGEKCVMRLLSARSRQFSLAELGINEVDLIKIKDAYKKASGMLLATGPTGSGKTTTIYSVLKVVNTRDVNIATIEDPVEYDIEGVNQIQVNPNTNLTFADGLRAILRQDPDIIFVGEIRDRDTAHIATNSAMTGHLVLSTLHTNDAATTLPRLLDMEIEPFLVASTVNIVIAQRLIRRICENCKVSDTVGKGDLEGRVSKELVEKHFGDKTEINIFHGKGCEVCHNSGFVGRVGVFEVLEITPEIKELIVQKASSDVIQKKAIEQGMTTMLDNGLSKVAMGVTTLEEIVSATKK